MNKRIKIAGLKRGVKFDVYTLAALVGVLLLVGSMCNDWIIQNKFANADILDAKGKVRVLGQVMAKNVELEDTIKQQTAELEAYNAKHPNPTREEIEAYVRMIFKKDNPNIALSVSHMECNPKNPAYPKCHNKSSIEHSVGIFQINLYNAKQWIHAARIPGNTMEEKIQWLENPMNNTLYAYWVYSTSGWSPWTTFTKGLYLNDPLMGGKK